MGVSDRDFLKRIQKEELVIYEHNDKKTVERIIYYCNRLQEHILTFGN